MSIGSGVSRSLIYRGRGLDCIGGSMGLRLGEKTKLMMMMMMMGIMIVGCNGGCRCIYL